MRKHSRSSRSSWLEKSSIHSGERYPRPCPAPLTLSHRVTLGLHYPLPQGISLPNHTMDVILGGGLKGEALQISPCPVWGAAAAGQWVGGSCLRLWLLRAVEI